MLSSSSGELFYAALSPNHSNEEVAATNQELLLLHGLAGSGKSFVIRARKALAESWEHPKGCTNMRTDRVSVTKNNEARFTSLPALRLTIFWTSFTHSIAAVLVSGMTIASMSSSRKTKVSKDDRLDYLSCKLLVVDEISMAGHLDLYYLDRLLSQVFGPSNSPFGSISVVLAGSSGCTMKFTILLKILYTPNFTY